MRFVTAKESVVWWNFTNIFMISQRISGVGGN